MAVIPAKDSQTELILQEKDKIFLLSTVLCEKEKCEYLWGGEYDATYHRK